MRRSASVSIIVCLSAALVLAGVISWSAAQPSPTAPLTSSSVPPPAPARPGQVQCARVVYRDYRTAVCFSDAFLDAAQRSTHIWTRSQFVPVKLGAGNLYRYPFAMITGRGSFELSEAQRRELRDYLMSGGFLVASAGCSSGAWGRSFRHALARLFPDKELRKLELSHPIFHTVYDIEELRTLHRADSVYLAALRINGRIAVVYSPHGLNDTAHVGGGIEGGCCCCGGNEIRNARKLNVNLLAYALTH